MAKLTIYFLFALFCFLAGCSNSGEIQQLKESVNTPILSVNGKICVISEEDIFELDGRKTFDECEIRKNPHVFKDKIVRIKASYGSMIHGSYLRNETECRGIDHLVRNLLHPDFISDKDYEYLEKIEAQEVKIIAVGKVKVVKPSKATDTIHNSTPYHFEIMCIEKVEKINRN